MRSRPAAPNCRALNYFAYNFIKIHRTLRVTPAMAAKVTDRLFDVSDIERLLEESESIKAAQWRLKGANAMKLRQMLRQRDSWLHLEFNVAVTVVVAIVLATVVSKFIGASLP
jgi:hypothetical protein